MKKNLFLILTLLISGSATFAENMTSIQNPVQNPNYGYSNRIFSLEETRPYRNIEKNKDNNRAILSIESRYNNKAPIKQDISSTENMPEQPKGLKGLFKGFVVEW